MTASVLLTALLFPLQTGDQGLESGQITQAFKVWIDAEKRPAREARVNRALQPRHGLFGVPQQGVNAGNLMVRVVYMTQGTRRIQRFPRTLQRGADLVAASAEQALKGNEEGIVLVVFCRSRHSLASQLQVSDKKCARHGKSESIGAFGRLSEPDPRPLLRPCEVPAIEVDKLEVLGLCFGV